MGRVRLFLTSARTTVGILLMLALLLLLNVAIPHEKYVGNAARDLADRSPFADFFLDTLGFSDIPTSPVFLAVLVVFLLNLTAVLTARAKTTINRTRPKAPARETLERWAEGSRSLHGRGTEELNGRRVTSALKGMGYRTVRVADGVAWGVKHRSAPIGFLVFHISFYLICIGGCAIYYTRFVGTSAMVEGQDFAGFNQVLRRSPLMEPPRIDFTLREIDAVLEDSHVLSLEATFVGDGGVEMASRINHPARLGPVKILVNRAGIAPVLWVQDAQGFTLDRIAVAAATYDPEPTEVELAGGELRVALRPVVSREHFPDRDELPGVMFDMVVVDSEGGRRFEGAVGVGEAVDLGSATLILQELRFWVGVYVVREYGSWTLTAGFVVGIIGLIWRLMLYRREVAVVWRGPEYSVAGRAEYFSNRFKQELDQLNGYLSKWGT